jgi:hypothetical protein
MVHTAEKRLFMRKTASMYVHCGARGNRLRFSHQSFYNLNYLFRLFQLFYSIQ